MSNKKPVTEQTDVKSPKFINSHRRKFMQSSAVASAVAASGVTLSSAATAAEAAAPAQPAEDAGYELTDRVRQYYKMARF